MGQVKVTTSSKAFSCHRLMTNTEQMQPQLIVWLSTPVSLAMYLKSLPQNMDENTLIEHVATDDEHHDSTILVHNNLIITFAVLDLANTNSTTHISDINRLDYVSPKHVWANIT